MPNITEFTELKKELELIKEQLKDLRKQIISVKDSSNASRYFSDRNI
jgi:uncharacterized protein (DUF342 family)